jgi:hypothetical protein
MLMRLGGRDDLAWAQATVTAHHYLRQRVDNRARPMVYVVEAHGQRVGLVMLGIPHATRCRGWWGYPGLPTQWQVVDLCRIWLDPRVQAGGEWSKSDTVSGFIDRRGEWRPTVASWAIGEVLGRVQRDRVSMWPPVFPEQPYHILLVISYHDPQFHRGVIYRAAGAEPMYTDGQGRAVKGPAGKFGWGWRLAEPGWGWQDIRILRPRNLRMAI